jgi:hypothetical protein
MPDGKEVKGVSWGEVLKDNPWMYSLGSAVSELWDSDVIGSPDIHSGNIMKRKDGTIVIIDPVWEGETPYQAYDKWIRDQMDFAKEYDEDYENNTSGPNYLEKNRPKIVSKIVDNFLDDIPFNVNS